MYFFFTDKPVAEQLRSIREEAGIGVREMARRLQMRGPSSYAHYEDPDRFKGPHLPVKLAREIAEVLASEGIPKARVLVLAGISADDPPAPEETLEARVSRLSDKRKRRVLEFLEDLEVAEEADRARKASSGRPSDA